ncbi:Glutaredoxin [Salmonella phage Vi01]|uniref:Glutaredoxin n=18 Tax=Kuttervirus TaxID=2169536 RepID=E1XT90_BPSAV|nr:Glutaredoxin [Salmonella phage Vi01]YP_004895247.1 glutaredoxin [Salmonella phage SFP10]YP_008770953.1 glutaredoxin [Salmonella phage Maynard]YP_008771744.1 glutaredoxin protein [Salmonella phage Marshall]YP_009101405.1 hypothetical protein PI33_gp009 [Escherichia phage ECML-4]YP_009140262.1 glutaredoxin [Salmonella phage Det7]YP_009283890.1 putative glutaredoxin [Salmonella phage GG32]YP_009617663.1 hypothetical protein FDI91_gp038 [Salmonella phage STML-13-1]YP_009876566.1 glutaredoxin
MITIYSKQGCAQCLQAENICRIRGIEHKILKLDKDYKLEELQKITGKQRMSMPVIVLADQTVTDVTGLAASLKR